MSETKQTETGRLSEDDYYRAVELTQVMSADIIVHDASTERYLVGKRKNEPAKGSLFVPGGRIYKSESITDGALRIVREETGVETVADKLKWIGVFEHVYDSNFRDDKFGTHYVVMAFCVTIPDIESFDPGAMLEQHESLVWLTEKELKEDNRVHEFTKAYFESE